MAPPRNRNAISCYGHARISAHGQFFETPLEASFYGGLLARAAAGDVRAIQRYVVFPLVVNGVRVGAYRADIVYEARVPYQALWGDDHSWTRVVVDCGSSTSRERQDTRMKFALMRALHGITVLVATPEFVRDLHAGNTEAVRWLVLDAAV